ncbi:MAG: hypothetical protein ACI8X5_002977 [Planctomycetota bacterium]|jgi:hypothetical protein
MSDLQHRIKVFVYSLEEGLPRYLLLRSSMGINPTWGALNGSIGFGEQIETAIEREITTDVGLHKPADLIDLGMPKVWLIGDEEVVEWPYGSLADNPKDVVLDSRWSEFRWAGYSEAYASFHLDLDRAAITRLHTMISAA